MALFRRTSSDAHWSKDYIEHLRSVHFVLIAVAVTCIAVSRTPDLNRLEKAKNQIHQILDVARDRQQRPPTDDKFIVVSMRRKTYFAEFEPDPVIIQLCQDGKPSNDWVLEDSWAVAMSNAENGESFARLWDGLNCEGKQSDKELLATMDEHDFSKEFVVFDQGKPMIGKVSIVEQGQSKSLRTRGKEKVFQLISDDFIEKTGLPPAVSGIVKHLRESVPNKSIGNKPINGLLVSDDLDNSFSVIIPTRFNVRQMPSDEYTQFARQYYMRQKFDDWECHDVFQVCFAELNVVGGSRRQYPLADVAAFIDGEVADQSKDFEVVGIKFPKEDLNRWGVILLCSILAYFCLHLGELSPKVSANDEGLDVAWVGLYPSWYSQCFLWLSIVVLPLIAISLLNARGSLPDFQPVSLRPRDFIPKWSDHTDFDLYDLSYGVCITLGVLCCLSVRKLAKLAQSARTSPESESATDLNSMD
jgi:hypothetical protein